MSIFNHSDYRAYLNETLETKCRKNPSLSLRSFAADLGISPSHLSRVLNGKKKLSLNIAHQICHRLELSKKEANYLAVLVEIETTTSDAIRAKLLKTISDGSTDKAKILPIEEFRVISDWYHFAILALTKVRGFDSRPSRIAQRLGITTLEAKLAVERLLSLGLLLEKGGNLTATHEANIATTGESKSAAIQENHRQHLERAKEALVEVPLDMREYNNLAVTMNKKLIPEAKKRIREFVTQFNEDFDVNQGHEVYQLNLQFYPLSKGDLRENN